MLVVDRQARIIEGQAVPFGVVAQPRMQLSSRFLFGSLVWDEWPPLLIDHSQSLRVGKIVAFQSLSFGLWMTSQVSRGAKGDRALEKATHTHRGLSIGIDPASAEFHIAPDGVEECLFGRIIEVSLTANPVFP